MSNDGFHMRTNCEKQWFRCAKSIEKRKKTSKQKQVAKNRFENFFRRFYPHKPFLKSLGKICKKHG